MRPTYTDLAKERDSLVVSINKDQARLSKLTDVTAEMEKALVYKRALPLLNVPVYYQAIIAPAIYYLTEVIFDDRSKKYPLLRISGWYIADSRCHQFVELAGNTEAPYFRGTPVPELKERVETMINAMKGLVNEAKTSAKKTKKEVSKNSKNTKAKEKTK